MDPDHAWSYGYGVGKLIGNRALSSGTPYVHINYVFGNYISNACANKNFGTDSLCGAAQGLRDGYDAAWGVTAHHMTLSSPGFSSSSHTTGADRLNENWRSFNKANEDMMNQKYKQFIENRQRSSVTGFCNHVSC
jgi:hypothetical protein